MKIHFKKLGWVLVLFLLSSMAAQAQYGATRAGQAANQQFTQQELDQMLAPIALYPDPLLTQVLMASTYPLEVVEAARWLQANPDLEGSNAVDAVQDQNWDPSVKSLVAFADVLQTMNDDLDWTQRLGDAFLSQQAQVMDSVQGLRQKAEAAGNLASTDQFSVDDQDGAIAIVPTDPGMLYVPYYDPNAIYGPWWWPAYPPVFWSPWAGYYWQGGFGWGIGISVGANFFYGDCDWQHHRVNLYDHGYRYDRSGGLSSNGPPHAWQHDVAHRRGVPYRNAQLDRQFGRMDARAEARSGFRGHAAPNFAPHGEIGNNNRAGPSRTFAPREQAPQFEAQARMPRFEAQARMPQFEASRRQAFEGVGRGPEVRGFSERGRAGGQHMSSPQRGSSSGHRH